MAALVRVAASPLVRASFRSLRSLVSVAKAGARDAKTYGGTPAKSGEL